MAELSGLKWNTLVNELKRWGEVLEWAFERQSMGNKAFNFITP
jgi:hypothetical protein